MAGKIPTMYNSLYLSVGKTWDYDGKYKVTCELVTLYGKNDRVSLP